MTLHLVLDTSGPRCLAALVDAGKGGVRVLGVRDEPMARGHAEALLPLIDDVFRHLRLAPRDIDAIAVVTGPGSFTGIRVGVAAARGLALALGRPAYGVTALEARALDAARDPAEGGFALADPSGRGEIALQLFDADANPTSGVLRLAEEEASAALPPALRAVGGRAAAQILAAAQAHGSALAFTDAPEFPSPEAIVACVARGQGTSPPSPLYLRPPDAKPQSGGVARLP
jgi:tRNA threonylcarbamoyladenosine biosynthesis protein TsaB